MYFTKTIGNAMFPVGLKRFVGSKGGESFTYITKTIKNPMFSVGLKCFVGSVKCFVRSESFTYISKIIENALFSDSLKCFVGSKGGESFTYFTKINWKCDVSRGFKTFRVINECVRSL